MIQSIFGKTKPINFIIVLTFLFFFYWLIQFYMFENGFNIAQTLLQVGVLGVLMVSFVLVNFIVKRNKMTGLNSFAILFYVLLMVVFPESLADNYAIGASFCMLLALRRLISLRSLKNIKLKVFDATIWVMVASLCYDWAVLYLALVLIAIYIYEPKNIRNWMVPFAGVFTFFMIAYAITILSGNKDLLWEHYNFEFDFKSSRFMDIVKSAKRVIYMILICITGLMSFFKLSKVGVGKIVTLRLVALSFVIGLVLEILLSGTESHPLMLTFFPAVVFLTNYVESINKPNIKEIVLMVSIFVPFLVFAADIILIK
ncbi:hypothetical protein JQC67_03850 [Aurantibacter crassamenti]|uniref:DUF6427 family protein n=1 Tax=Aurantibacter crassamenti TaxID=1837375 RepID=UPI001939806D|nr:DUF6427 family protein [Aurantibacter crassamenti]MBM1105267.1 hypothetical protein [Aurantibacter crassamenti]